MTSPDESPPPRSYPSTPETLTDADELRRQRDEALDALESLLLAGGLIADDRPATPRAAGAVETAREVLRRAGRLA